MTAKLQYSYVYEGANLELTKGLCANNPDPDLWFSQENFDKGSRPTEHDKEVLVIRTLTALNICKKCPIKDTCLAEGMKEDNLDWGIWGGTLPAERLAVAGKPMAGHDRYNKVLFSNKVRTRQALMKEYGYDD